MDVSFTQRKDYSIRVQPADTSEMFNLADSLNNMIIELEDNFNKRKSLVDELNQQNKELQREILERQEVEKSLVESENKYKSLYNTIMESFINLDSDGFIKELNPSFCKLTGYLKDDLINKNISEFFFDDIFSPSSKFRLQLISKGHSEIIETQLIRINHEIVNVEMSGHLSQDNSGNPYDIWLIMRDITERKNSEKQLLQAQKMETVGNLAGGLAHDFNNVLAGIVGTISVMKLNSLMINNPDLNESISIIERASLRASNMVQQLLAVSRKNEITLKTVDLNKSVQHVYNICENTFDKSVSIVCNYNPEPAMIMADPTQIEQVILNLCVNGYHAMTIMKNPDEHRGGILKICIEKAKFSDYAHLTNNVNLELWSLKISDNGVGIPKNNIGKIFDPFFSTKDKEKGSGLGLSMVYNIIKRHKGYIDVNTSEGTGSTFTLFFRASTLDEFETISEDENEVHKGTGLILIIDDEEMIRNLGKRILTMCGYETIVAENGLKGIEIYKEKYNEIDLVILDMAMPVLSGKETYFQLKEINPEIKTLMASGFKQDDRVVESLDAGVNAFIQKPFTISKLSTVVRDVLDGKYNNCNNFSD
ncbi:MAG: response regulator [Candidatus Cloacimonetes bacterium]|nr:response regulator [Candidatus Cloacimonadota bacterium]